MQPSNDIIREEYGQAVMVKRGDVSPEIRRCIARVIRVVEPSSACCETDCYA